MDVMRNIALIGVLLLVTGCGGGGTPSASSAIPHTAVSGIVFASAPFTSGTVSIYDFSAGAKGGLLVSGSVDSTGAYHLTVPASSGAIMIEAASGCYTEKGIPFNFAVGQYPSVLNAVTASVCSATTVLSAAVLVPYGVTSLIAAVTPYTHAAVGLAEYEIRTGSTMISALYDANTRLSQWVGTDIQSTVPAAPARSSTFGNATLYGSLLSGMPGWLLNVATTSPAVFGAGDLTSLAFAEAMRSDLAQDGVLNGVGRDANGNAVALQIRGIALTTSIYRHGIALYAVERVRGETEGALNSTPEEQARIVSFLPSFVAYNDAANSLLDTSALVALDEGGPVVIIGYPTPGLVLTNNNGMAGFVHDPAGILVYGTVMLIDGAQYTPFGNQYIPNHFINTTIFANGPHTLTIQATNTLGHVGSASVNVTFRN